MTTDWLYLTEATAGDLSTLHRAGDLAVVHYAASVADKTLPQAVQGLLKAMGKDTTVTGMRGHASESVPVLPVWLTAHSTQTVILSRAQSWQRPQILTELIRLLATTAVRVVVATDPSVPSMVPSTLRGLLPTPVDASTIVGLVTDRPASTEDQALTDPQEHVHAKVPSSDWHTFRYDCRSSLAPDTFARLDAAYVAAFGTARVAVAQSRPTNESTLEILTRILHTTQDTETATAAFRGTQAAYFEAGYSLRLDPSRLISLYAHTRAPAYTQRDWMALRAYLDPARPATCTLHAHGLTLREIAAFTIAEARESVTSSHVNDQPLNRHAATYLNANLLHQQNNGATADAPYIPLHPISRVLHAAGKDVGILTAGKPTQTSAHTKAIWTAGTGFLLKAIA